MRRSIRFLLPVVISFAGCSESSAKVQLQLALFSKRQSFWPSLDTAWKPDPARIGVLPVYLERYQESKPCDSCHRLSEDGMEFFLGNALRRILDSVFLGNEVELVGPHWDLLKSRKVEFPGLVDSLNLPWKKWLGDGSEALIYRPRERMASGSDKIRLDKAAGALGFSHLFIVRGFRVSVQPNSRSSHRGGLDWEWHGALYNTREGRFEWALRYSHSRKSVDLDDDLEPLLAGDVLSVLRGMPANLTDLLSLEPR